MYAGKKSNSHYLVKNRIRLVKGGQEYFDLLEDLIHQAKTIIHLQVYIYDDDFTGKIIGDALIKAAQRNVQVFLLVDGYASQSLAGTYIKQLKDAGIHFHYFQPLLKSSHFYFGRRMHQKVVSIDGEKALVGGINIADRYNDVDGPAWLDYAIYIEGEAATELNKYCIDFWKSARYEIPVLNGSTEAFLSQIPKSQYTSVRIRRNDWVKGKHEVWKSYFDLFTHAQKSITIMCSYFLPGIVLRRQLSKAVKRGVEVKVILAGPSDVMIVKQAERYLYQWMLRNKIRIFEYQPTVLHSKMAVADDHWVTIGSFNVNNISAYASIELNVDVRNRKFATNLQQVMNGIIEKDCIEVTPKNFATNVTIFKKFIYRSCYDLIRVVLNLSTFYFKHE